VGTPEKVSASLKHFFRRACVPHPEGVEQDCQQERDAVNAMQLQ
jgi:hypothetical protein